MRVIQHFSRCNRLSSGIYTAGVFAAAPIPNCDSTPFSVVSTPIASGVGDMASGADDVTMVNLEGGKSKGRKDKHVQAEGSGCWMKFKFMGKCMPLRSGKSGQDESKYTNDTSRGQPVAPVGTSSTNINAITGASAHNKIDELKIASNLRRFSFHELKLVTRNFRPEYMLGEGGFGRVFKGWISERGKCPARPGTGIPVAVKTLNHEGLQGHKEWLAEVIYLGELHHENLVRLIGHCIEGKQRLLVYEFMPRGSLEHHLFKRTQILAWPIRMKILLGAAKGLAFLHEEIARPVIFRDFKTSNILLDADYNAKLSDFGLAKDGPEGDSTHVSTRVMGTQGYAAPEYVMTGHLSPKSDVYSFGVVLLEMLTGRKSIDRSRPPGEHNLTDWARSRLMDRKRFYQLIDPRLDGNFSIKGAWKACVVAARCLQHNPKARPRMSEVVSALTSLLELNDMASASPSFQVMQNSRNAQRTQSGISRTPSRSPNGMQATPSRSPNAMQASPLWSPNVMQVSPWRFNHSPLCSPSPCGGNH
ncbi:hypothetical protein L6164_005957 [Bauhinia variegata]|uniref:Uncharacterized protein n=1 Tax=Bauhinia variegata TaxID=167791 RepID=A0ACB9PSE3_BAUVA|nr:hypothetical protein L6164_005957 [Bauhinia variegata]